MRQLNLDRLTGPLGLVLAGMVAALAVGAIATHEGAKVGVALIIAPPLAWFVFSRPRNALIVGLAVVVALPYWYKFGFLVLNLGAGLAILAILLATQRGARFRWTYVDAAVIAILLAILADWWLRRGSVAALRQTFDTVSPLAFYFAARLVRGPTARVITWTLVIAATLGTLTMFAEFAKGSPLFYAPSSYDWNGGTQGAIFRPAGVFGSPPAAVLVLAMVALAGIAIFPEVTGRPRSLLAGCLALILIAGFITFTRAGWIGFGAGLLTSMAMMWLWGGAPFPRWLVYVPVAAAVAVLLLPTFSSTSWFQAGVQRGGTLAYRQTIWSQALPLVADTTQHLLFGHGFDSLVAGSQSQLGGLQADLAEVPLLVQHGPHNMYIEALLEQGVLGLFVLLAWLGGALVTGLRQVGKVAQPDRRLVAGLTGATICFLVSSLADASFREPNTVTVIALLTGLLVSLCTAPAVRSA